MVTFSFAILSRALVPVLSTGVVWALLCCCATVESADTRVPPDLPTVQPQDAGLSAVRLNAIDDVVQEGLRRENMPGCVVMVGYQGSIVYHKAFGYRQLVPEKQPMQTDTVFDMASLTKPIATATSVMTLIEAGKIQLEAPVARYIPEFAVNGKADITVRQLLVHMGGLIPDNAMKDYAGTPAESMEKIYALSTYVPPGEKFVYTDVGFIVLADLVQRVSGMDVHQYSQQKIFQPLGMHETGYLPDADLQARAAVTQERNGQLMRGQVHDPRAWALGGIAGHAGLFSTASDLARYGQMLLNGGSLNGVVIMQPETVALMIQPVEVSSGLRGLGWDIKSPYSSNRGDLFSPSAFGHGGFTGTAMWMDPELQMFVIFLSNRVHPDGKGSVNALAGRIGTLAAAAIREE